MRDGNAQFYRNFLALQFDQLEYFGSLDSNFSVHLNASRSDTIGVFPELQLHSNLED